MMLEFVTLTTGNVMHYDRSSVTDTTIHRLQQLIRAGGRLPNGWSVTVHEATAQQASFDLLLNGILVTHCWLCQSEAVADLIWRKATIEANLPLVIAEHRPTTVPWLAVGMAISIIEIVQNYPERIFEAAEIEICMAWALIEMTAAA